MNIESTELQNSTETAIDYSTCYAQPSIQLFNCDNVGGMVSGGFKTTNLSKRTEVNE